MKRDSLNYGLQREYKRPTPPRSSILPGTTEERTWSALAHLSIFLNLFTGFLGPVAAFIMWLAFRDRSRIVAAHAIRSMWYQIAWALIIIAGWTVTGILTVVLIGFLLWPVMFLLMFVPFIHASYAAYRAYRGDDYRYI